MTLSKLISLTGSNSIQQLYNRLDYDYGQEKLFSSNPDLIGERRKKFLDIFSWKVEPQSEYVLRLFNQINTHYAEDWALQNLHINSLSLLKEINNILLYRQSKQMWLRKENITYGRRVHLDVLDVYKSIKWLRGINPKFLPDIIHHWSQAVDIFISNHKITKSVVLAMTMLFIAIHPFEDGNGRIARIIYSWLLKKNELELLWLREADDGEIYRSGFKEKSTEYLMGTYISELCGNYNDILTYDDDKAYSILLSNIKLLLKDFTLLLNSITFRRLEEHLEKDNHYVKSSPRFESLITIIE